MTVSARYSTVAIALHWLIALLILLLIPMGWWMTNAISDPATQAQAYRLFQLHKALGFLVLALTIIRIVWRWGHRPPPLPANMKRWEGFAARTIQFTFYALLLALPLSGWIYVSAGWAVGQDSALDVATSWFGMFTIPHLAPIADLAEETRRAIAFITVGAHEWLAWGAVTLVALHAGAAVKHRIIDRDSVLASMLPWSKPHSEPLSVKEEYRWLPLFTGIATVAALLIAGAIAHAPPPRQILIQGKPAETPVKLNDAPITAGTAIQWVVDTPASAIRFSGTHAGAAFTGRFTDWKASIWFDPANLAGSKAFVDVSTASARTGDPTQEGSLQDGEWFDPDNFPTARFEATTFRALGGDRYEATGTLRVKAAEVPVILPFTFTEQAGVAAVRGELTLDRIALEMGLVSDATAAWVSKDIKVEIDVIAKRTQ